MRTVHVVLPGDIDDPRRPSGGNVYDRRVCDGLRALGWTVREHTAEVADVLAGLPDEALVLVDGLVAPANAELLDGAADRLRLVILMHMPLGPEVPGEREALIAASAVVTTSRWSRRRLLEWYDLPPDRVRVAEPGVDPAAPAPGTPSGGALLSVGAVTPGKGYDVLVTALATIDDLDWSCTCVGSLDVDPAYADLVGGQIEGFGLADRARLVGPLDRDELDSTYARADLLVLASRAESYGMVVTEALAHGLPVVASDVGGVREAHGRGRGDRPGALVPADDPKALAEELRRWLLEPARRARLRRAAAERRLGLGDWQTTSALVAGVLAGVGS